MASSIKNIPAIQVGDQLFEIKDLGVREHLIEIQDDQPTSDENRVWVKEEKEVSPLAVPIPETNDDYTVDLGNYPYMEVGNIKYKTPDGRYAGVHVVSERATSECIQDLKNEETRIKTTLQQLIVWKTEKAKANGVATLGSDGKVPSTQLPSYVDDVLEYDNRNAFPATGETGKIYIAKDTQKCYRWSGSTYFEISQAKDVLHDLNDLTAAEKYNYTWSVHRLENEFTSDRNTISNNNTAINARAKAIEDDVLAKDTAINARAKAIEDDVLAKDTAINTRAKAIEDSVGAANGIASLDTNTRVPVDQLQNGIDDASTTATNKTWSAKKINYKLTAAAEDVTAKDTAINARAKAIEDDVLAKDTAINARIKVIEDSVGAASGIASLDAHTKVPVDQLQNIIDDNSTGDTNKTWSAKKTKDEFDVVALALQTTDSSLSDLAAVVAGKADSSALNALDGRVGTLESNYAPKATPTFTGSITIGSTMLTESDLIALLNLISGNS